MTYLTWLHKLTTELYKHNIILTLNKHQQIKLMYENKTTLKQAIKILKTK